MGPSNVTTAFNSTTGFNGTTGSNTTGISSASSAHDALPLDPRLTPALGVAGALLILTGLAYSMSSIKIERLYMSLSCAYLVSICVTVLIVYTMSLPSSGVQDAVQGGYLVAAVLPGIILGGVCQQYFQPFAKRAGCFLGGFCIAMWLEVLSPGGLIKSSPMLAVFISLMSVAGFALSFFRITEDPAFIISSAFSGATAVVLGIDCYSRAGLKEFWVYTWHFQRDELFGCLTTTYPLTRGIKAEIGMIPVLFALAIMAQYRFYKPIRARKEEKAREAAQLREDQENQELNTGRAIQTAAEKERSAWEAKYKDPEKKKPDVEETQISPDSPSKTGHRKSHSTATLTQARPDSARILMAKRDEKQLHDEILPVEAPTDKTETLDTLQARHSSPIQECLSLRPKSYPPRPIIAQSGDERDSSSDGIDYVNMGSGSPSLPFLADRVSSLGLALDMEDNEGRVVSDHGGSQIESSLHLSEPHEHQELAPTASKPFRLDPSDWEKDVIQEPDVVGEQVADEENLVPKGQHDVNEQPQDTGPKPKGSDLAEIAASHNHDEKHAHLSECAAIKRQEREEIMDRTMEWSKTLIHAESKSRASSIRSYNPKDEVSLWSGFEGTHTTETTADQLDGQDLIASQPSQPGLSRVGALKQNKSRSKRVSIAEGTTAILPAPVISKRVRERNSSLPVLNTGPSLLDQLSTMTKQKHEHESLATELRRDGSQGFVARSNFGSMGNFNLDELPLSHARATLQARRASNSQVSTISSQAHRTSSSVGCISPAITTARTTPTAASPAHTHPAVSPTHTHPPFIMVAHPLRKPYPVPSCEAYHPTTPYRYSIGATTPYGMNNPAYLEDTPASTIQPNGIRSPHTPRRSSIPVPGAQGQTLIKHVEEAEKSKKQTTEMLAKAQSKAVADSTRARKQVEARRRALQATEYQMSAKGEEAHREYMRKMQRQCQ